MTKDLFSHSYQEDNTHAARREAAEQLDALFRRAFDLSNANHICQFFDWMAKLRHYSLFNLWLARLQRPGCGLIATEKRWRELQRNIKSSAIPIVILRPMGPVMLVYEVGDTTGPPLPNAYFNVQGTVTDRDLERLVRNSSKDSIRTETSKLGANLGGDVRNTVTEQIEETFLIRLNKDRKVEERFRTMCHELAHIYCGHLGRPSPQDWWLNRADLGTSEKEFEAEGAAFLVLSRAGLLTGSDKYLSYHAKNCDLTKVSMDTIIRAAARIETHWQPGSRHDAI